MDLTSAIFGKGKLSDEGRVAMYLNGRFISYVERGDN